MAEDERRPVLVTGANSGIGLATLLEVSRRGFRAFGSVRSTAKARSVREAAQAAGVEVSTVQLDVTNAAVCRRAMDQVRPWGLVNNAGTSFTGAVEDVDDQEARAALETMVVAPMRLARLALPHMRARGGGRIVNVSSIYGLTSTPLTGWYQASKHALEALSDALRMEVARDGVEVVLVEPGSFRTGIWGEAEQDMGGRDGSRYGDVYRRSLGQIRLAQPFMGVPETVARVIGRVGADARAMSAIQRVLPDQVKDRVSRLILGL